MKNVIAKIIKHTHRYQILLLFQLMHTDIKS